MLVGGVSFVNLGVVLVMFIFGIRLILVFFRIRMKMFFILIIVDFLFRVNLNLLGVGMMRIYYVVRFKGGIVYVLFDGCNWNCFFCVWRKVM